MLVLFYNSDRHSINFLVKSDKIGLCKTKLNIFGYFYLRLEFSLLYYLGFMKWLLKDFGGKEFWRFFLVLFCIKLL